MHEGNRDFHGWHGTEKERKRFWQYCNIYKGLRKGAGCGAKRYMAPGGKEFPHGKRAKKFRASRETFGRADSSIPVQPGMGCPRQARVSEQKPRGGSRGANDTQFFRPLVQEEVVS